MPCSHYHPDVVCVLRPHAVAASHHRSGECAHPASAVRPASFVLSPPPTCAVQVFVPPPCVLRVFAPPACGARVCARPPSVFPPLCGPLLSAAHLRPFCVVPHLSAFVGAEHCRAFEDGLPYCACPCPCPCPCLFPYLCPYRDPYPCPYPFPYLFPYLFLYPYPCLFFLVPCLGPCLYLCPAPSPQASHFCRLQLSCVCGPRTPCCAFASSSFHPRHCALLVPWQAHRPEQTPGRSACRSPYVPNLGLEQARLHDQRCEVCRPWRHRPYGLE
mmetsp:Transcript_45486/g.120678  ORF Transcript_45486/g.120678 Transcript_45486/m.120678 type:complete len:272 (-) Transcript_45486:281-1096(-)